jgi:hypothetical protein
LSCTRIFARRKKNGSTVSGDLRRSILEATAVFARGLVENLQSELDDARFEGAGDLASAIRNSADDISRGNR